MLAIRKRQTDETYGLLRLPPLTIPRACQLLKVDEDAFVTWIEHRVRPSGPQWTRWVRPANHPDRRNLPDSILHLWLADHPDGVGTTRYVPSEPVARRARRRRRTRRVAAAPAE